MSRTKAAGIWIFYRKIRVLLQGQWSRAQQSPGAVCESSSWSPEIPPGNSRGSLGAEQGAEQGYPDFFSFCGEMRWEGKVLAAWGRVRVGWACPGWAAPGTLIFMEFWALQKKIEASCEGFYLGFFFLGSVLPFLFPLALIL